MNKMKLDNISQISIIASPISLDRVMFIIKVKGIAMKKAMPVANSFLSLSLGQFTRNYTQTVKRAADN
ncbi:MAG: hypothetical protein MJ134_05620, partial [Lachnospiraceae bacterium]|nr:hypothetical protein [Lachnospiraceae bacterium]